MQKLKLIILTALTTLTIGFVMTPAYAATCTSPKDCVNQGLSSAGGSNAKTDIGPFIKTIVNVLLFILGAVAVVMIVIGGIRYATSQGESSAISGAKNTILYSVIGLVVANMAYAIVNFVISNF